MTRVFTYFWLHSAGHVVLHGYIMRVTYKIILMVPQCVIAPDVKQTQMNHIYSKWISGATVRNRINQSGSAFFPPFVFGSYIDRGDIEVIADKGLRQEPKSSGVDLVL